LDRTSRRIAGVQGFSDLLVTEREGFEPSVPRLLCNGGIKEFAAARLS
jgi:hypothetical protein